VVGGAATAPFIDFQPFQRKTRAFTGAFAMREDMGKIDASGLFSLLPSVTLALPVTTKTTKTP
jgi:hypothetical protein